MVLSELFDCREDCREGVRACHVYLMQLGMHRIDLFTVLYGLHLYAPIVCILLFVRIPCIRPAMIMMVCLTVIVQLVSRTCPVVKLENALAPEAVCVTWATAKYLEMVGITVNNTTRFWWMIVCTFFAILSLVAFSLIC